MFKSVVFSLYYPLCQLVTGIALFIFWYTPGIKPFKENFIKYKIFVLLFIISDMSSNLWTVCPCYDEYYLKVCFHELHGICSLALLF